MALDVKQYAEQLLQEAGADDATKQAFLNLVSNEKVAKRLSTDILMQSDYNRNMDALRSEKEKAIASEQRNAKYYADLLQWKADTEAQVQASLANNGNDNGNHQVIQPVQGDFISKKEFEAKFQEQGTTFVNLLKDAMALTSTHVYEFKEPLDTEALTKIAIEKQIPIRQAYDEFVAPRRAEVSKATRESEIAKAREEGAREYASKHKLPVDSQPREYHVMFDRDQAKQEGAVPYVPNTGQLTPTAKRQLRDSFADAWNTPVPTGNTSGT